MRMRCCRISQENKQYFHRQGKICAVAGYLRRISSTSTGRVKYSGSSCPAAGQSQHTTQVTNNIDRTNKALSSSF